MKIVVAIGMLLSFSTCLADDLPSPCGDIAKIKSAIAAHSEYYGDVNLTIKCKAPQSKAETLICTDKHLFAMYKLNSMAEVYAFENASKREIEHKTYKPVIPKCKTKFCICKAFIESTNDSLGGESPYYIDE